MASCKQMAKPGRDGGPKQGRKAYNGAVREHLTVLQRARMISAMFDVCSERGAGNVSVAHVVERSGVSRRTFYEVFEDREDCMLAAYEQALSMVSECVIPAYEAQKGWRERLRAGLVAFLSFLDEQPNVGGLLVSQSLAGGPRVLARRGETLGVLAKIVDHGRDDAKSSVTVGPLTAEGVVGGALAVIESHMTGSQPLVALTNPLMSMIVLPYLGAAAARRELERPTPVPTIGERNGTQDSPGSSVLFKDLGIRFTYRTVRVLVAIAEADDGSNRQIGENAGVTDQGQISKLLRRLARIGLIENTYAHPGKGAPNSWALTEQGRQVVTTIRAHSEPPISTSNPTGTPGVPVSSKRRGK